MYDFSVDYDIIYVDDILDICAKLIKWSNTLKQIVGKLPTICLSVFDHFSGLALKYLMKKHDIKQCLDLLKNVDWIIIKRLRNSKF